MRNLQGKVTVDRYPPTHTLLGFSKNLKREYFLICSVRLVLLYCQVWTKNNCKGEKQYLSLS